MLEAADTSLLIIEERVNDDIVIGVPHHAPAGNGRLPCDRVSDENAGFLGRYIAEKLDCCSIIACNYEMDVNKSLESDYSLQIIKWRPKTLVEIHGYGRNAHFNIEISSGASDNDIYSKQLADELSDRLSEVPQLMGMSVCGEYDKIYFQASRSATITDDRWIAFHIELPMTIRIPEDDLTGKPPRLGYQFCDCLVDALNEMGLHVD
jgi:hypothetical protein